MIKLKHKLKSKRLTQDEKDELQLKSDIFDAYFDRQLPDDWDDMSEGELAAYMAGF